MMEEEDEHDDGDVLPFDRHNVSKIDIVASKIRTYNNKHPGNIFYVQLVQEKVKTVEYDVPSEYTRVANEIVDILCEERGGRFLKLKDGEKDHTTCTVMKRKEAVGKVAHALRTAQKKRDVEFPDPPEGFVTGCKPGGKTKKLQQTPKKTKKQKEQQQDPSKVMNSSPDPAPSPAPPPAPAPLSKRKPKKQKPITSSAEKATKKRGRPSLSSSSVPSLPLVPPPEEKAVTKRAKPTCHYKSDSDVLLYEAQAGESMPIDPYTLKLISLVCNQHIYGVDDAFKILDAPIEDYTLENEPDKHRLMRLQMRHRFASAAATGLSPLDFSIKLLKLWGGKLVEVVQAEEGEGGTSPRACSSSRNENEDLVDEFEYESLAPNAVAFVPPPPSPPPATFQELEKEADMMMMMDPHSTTLDMHMTMPQQQYHHQQQDLLLFQTEASSATRLDTDENMFLGTSNNLDGDILPPPPPMETDHTSDGAGDDDVELNHPVDLELEERPVSELSVSEKAPSPNPRKFKDPIPSYAQKVQNPDSVTVIQKTFKWKTYPEMEQFLIDNRDDYLKHSNMNYTKDQKDYNNRLTHRLLEHAAQHDYLFDEHGFKTFKDIRDRIRCYYKSYVQSMRNRRGKRGMQTKKDLDDKEEEGYEDIEEEEEEDEDSE